MAVYILTKDCKGCEIGSGYQKDHNHPIMDSYEYEEIGFFDAFKSPFFLCIVSLCLYGTINLKGLSSGDNSKIFLWSTLILIIVESILLFWLKKQEDKNV